MILLLATPATLLGFTDDEFRYRTLKIPESVRSELEKSIQASEKELAEGVFDPKAATILDAAGEFTRAVFNLPSLRLVRAVTHQDNGDVLVVRWSVDEAFTKGTVYLQDSPYVSRYELCLTNGVATKEDVAAFVSKLIIFRKTPINLMFREAIEILLPENRPIGAFFVNTTLSSTGKTHEFSIRAAQYEKDWLVEVLVGKSFTESYYPVQAFIPERFPPLSDLMKSWSFERIWSEVGTPVGPHSWEDYSENRDRIRISELIRRGVSKEQFGELLRTADSALLQRRAAVVMSALGAAGEGPSLNRYFEPALATYERIGPAADSAVQTVFLSASRACATPYEATAMRLLKEGIFVEGALLYLGQCSTSKETLQTIESFSAPNELRPQKETALNSIRARIGKIRN
jgi:hypothetical protein